MDNPWTEVIRDLAERKAVEIRRVMERWPAGSQKFQDQWAAIERAYAEPMDALVREAARLEAMKPLPPIVITAPAPEGTGTGEMG